MAVNWTDDQMRVIDTRGSNILVSAAAGSGKTAVLVERILARITDPADPVDIDELLIVTFTRAAAGEMRERIRKVLAERIAQNPEDEHLATQPALLGNARITTIDGFCSYVVRSYAQTIGVAPGFQTADESVSKLLLHDCLDAVLEEAYSSEDAEERRRMADFAETFAANKSEKQMEDAILAVYRAAESSPYPEAWLAKCRKMNHVGSGEELAQTDWMRAYLTEADELIAMSLAEARMNLAVAESEGGPAAFIPAAEKFVDFFENLSETDDYEARREKIASFSAPDLRKRNKNADPALLDAFRTRHGRLKKNVEELGGTYYAWSLADAAADIEAAAGPLDMLLTLVERLMKKCAEEKEARNLMDFGDVEHFALRILREPAGEAGQTSSAAGNRAAQGSENAENRTRAAESRASAGAQDLAARYGKRTEAARELAAGFREVMIDEYQDSNYLQEAILTAVSRIEDGDNNYFCVGDVKQSIYRFRKAKPELFMEKFREYKEHPAAGTRIDLHKNFRSRQEVVDTVNGIFRQIMRAEVGGVEYDEDAALVCGADFSESATAPENGKAAAEKGGAAAPLGSAPDASGAGQKPDDRSRTGKEMCPLPPLDVRTEIIPVFMKEDLPDMAEDSLLEDRKELTKQEIEARAVGARITAMVGHESIWDPKAHVRRPVEYRDIVILSRAKTGFGTCTQVFEDMRIPSYTEARAGYFQATEVKAVLNYLRILDNPQQDIPFCAALTAPFAGLEAADLAEVRTADGAAAFSGSTRRSSVSMYDAARYYAEKGTREDLRHTLGEFFSFYDRTRAEMRDIALPELVASVIEDTGYGDYAASLPGGAQRAVNLRMLIDQAVSFEKTGYTGLFHFIRYIDSLGRQDIDPGELSSISEQENVVRLMSIHKSKGLEFPIVFVTGLGTRFNLSDTTGNVLIQDDMGIASDYIDYERRVRTTTLRKEAVKSRLVREDIGEELRVLYVAMTRAKQKLILVGSMASEDALEDLYLNIPRADPQLPEGYIFKARDYWSLIMPAVRRILTEKEWKNGRSGAFLDVRPTAPSALAAEEMNSVIRREEPLDTLRGLVPGKVYDPEMKTMMDERLGFHYPYAGYENIPTEVSVSEIKAGKFEDGADSGPEPVRLYPEKRTGEMERTVPDFIRQRDTKRREEAQPEEQEAGGKAISEDTAKHPAGEYLPQEDTEAVPAEEKKESGRDEKNGAWTGKSSGSRRTARLRGAALGTAYHKVMQMFSFDREACAPEGISREMERLFAAGRLTEEEYVSVNPADIAKMILSPLGKRMTQAAVRGDLFREQPFVLGVPAAELRPEWPASEMVFVQGIIDAFFYEDGEIVLVDYKTDYAEAPEALAAHYSVQLAQYKNALERVTGSKVKESILWSFHFGCEIRV